MNKEIIEKYIQIAIDNGFDFEKTSKSRYWVCFEKKNNPTLVYYHSRVDYKINLIELMTSQEFIEVVARIIIEHWEEWTLPKNSSKHMKRKWVLYFLWGNISNIIWFTECEKDNAINYIIKWITHNQADAIRDLKLEEFISKLIPHLTKN